MDYHADLKRLLRALREFDETGLIPADVAPIEAACERILEADPFEAVARRWRTIVASVPEETLPDEPWRR